MNDAIDISNLVNLILQLNQKVTTLTGMVVELLELSNHPQAVAPQSGWKNPTSPYCGTEEAAKFLGKSVGTIRRWAENGTLRKYRPEASGSRGPFLLLKSEVMALAKSTDS